MTRSVSSIISTATSADLTTPVYLIYMAWDIASPDVNRRICTWDTDISWDGETWAASGATVDNLKAEGGTLKLPNGDGDPWLSLVHTDIPLDRTVLIYEHHTDRSSSPWGQDAVLLFSGRMDATRISGMEIRIDLIEGRTNKGFPPGSIGPPTYNWLLTPGTRLYWGPDIITVN